VLAVSLVMIMLDNTILNVALPGLARSLKASESQLQWMRGAPSTSAGALQVEPQPARLTARGMAETG